MWVCQMLEGAFHFTVNLETLSRYCITIGFLGLDFLVLSLLYALFEKNTFNDIVYLIITNPKVYLFILQLQS